MVTIVYNFIAPRRKNEPWHTIFADLTPKNEVKTIVRRALLQFASNIFYL